MNLKQAAAEVGVAGATASRWIAAGLIQPPNYVGVQRVPVEMGSKEIRELGFLKRLRTMGFSMQSLKKATVLLRELGANPFSEPALFGVGVRGPEGLELVRLVDGDAAVALVRRPGQGVLFLVPLSPEKADVAAGQLPLPNLNTAVAR